MTTPVSASMVLGGHTYTTAPGSLAFTHAQLPGTTCVPGDAGFTQFSLHSIRSPDDAPWDLDIGTARGVLILSYFDQLMRDGFPTSPTPRDALLFFTSDNSGFFNASVELRAVDDLSPVPEPGSLTLLGIGLVAAYRRARAARR